MQLRGRAHRKVPRRDQHMEVPMDKSIEERFWDKVDKTGTCWIWTAYKKPNGYGQFMLNGRPLYAHRLAYELLVGLIPEGFEIDHVRTNGCTSLACVKAVADKCGPAHLEAVTHRENNRRSDSRSAKQSRQTHCIHGHALAGDNLAINCRGERQCIACRRFRMRGYYWKQKDAKGEG